MQISGRQHRVIKHDTDMQLIGQFSEADQLMGSLRGPHATDQWDSTDGDKCMLNNVWYLWLIKDILMSQKKVHFLN